MTSRIASIGLNSRILMTYEKSLASTGDYWKFLNKLIDMICVANLRYSNRKKCNKSVYISLCSPLYYNFRYDNSKVFITFLERSVVHI